MIKAFLEPAQQYYVIGSPYFQPVEQPQEH